MYYTVNTKAFLIKGEDVNICQKFAVLQNAFDVAKELSSCEDVYGAVDIINQMTGEIEGTFFEGAEIYLSNNAKSYFGITALKD